MEILNTNDVVSVIGQSKGKFASGDTFKLQQLLEEYVEYTNKSAEDKNNSKIFSNSIECEVLRHDREHKGWRKGKIKFVVQFEPEKEETSQKEEISQNIDSLDSIWQQID
ncbi:MAG: KGK domain-containing protein [Cyanobacteria bacterium P01_G01_bin.19]